MKALYDTVNARALQSWLGPVNRDSYDKFAKHWIACAVNLKNEFEGAGLLDTATELSKIIDLQVKYCA